MYSHNKTAMWLNAKSPAEKAVLFQTIKKQSRQIKEEFHQRQLEINNIRRAEAIKEMRKAEEQRKKKQKMREELTDTIQSLGFWTSEEEVDASLERMKKVSEKVKALKGQLKYRQEVIRQEAPRELFAYSHHRHIYNWRELAANLKKLITQSEGYSPR
jgi:hypothetical protein